MKIVLGGRHPIHVDTGTISAWFPQLVYTHKIDGTGIVHHLASRISVRYGITTEHIRRTLSELFTGLGRYPGYEKEQTQMRIIQVLVTKLVTDDEYAHLSKGFRGSRNTFITLAYLASDYESVLLAEALSLFLAQGVQLIQKELPRYVRDWQKAAKKIREVMEEPATMDFEPFAMVPHAGWHRGRSPRALALPWPGHRSRSLPAIRRRHSPDMRLAIPTYPSSGWASPMISPVGYPRGDYFDELQNLQWQQSEMSMQLSSVDGKLDFLLAGGIC